MIATAFILGLVTSLHCVGMCGPIALSLGLSPQQAIGFYVKNITYQFGRITTYSLFGLVVGIFGVGVQLAISQQYISIFVGIAMMAMVLLPKNISVIAKTRNPFSRILLQAKLALGKLLGKSNYKSLYTIGLLNGLLPCGPVYVALTAAIASKTVIESIFFMFLYGLGTLPLMFLTVLLGNAINQEYRNKILKFYPVLLFVLGLLFVLRGMELGIPYISPSENALQIAPTVKCH